MIPEIEPETLESRPGLATWSGQLWRPAWAFSVRRLSFVQFALVGASGMLVNTAVLYLLVEAFRLPHLIAAAIAAELSILSNFLFNDSWTFRASRSSRRWSHRLWRYNLVALGGMLIAILLLAAFIQFTTIYYLLANILAVALSTLCNYYLNRRWTWPAMNGSIRPVLQTSVIALADVPMHPTVISLTTQPSSHDAAIATPDFARLSRKLPLGQLLVDAGLISRSILDEALSLQQSVGVQLGAMLVSLGHLRGDHLALALAYQHGIDTFKIEHLTSEQVFPGAQPGSWYATRRVIPIIAANNMLRVVTADATDDALMADVEKHSGRKVHPVIATHRDIETTLHALYREPDLTRSSQFLRTNSPQNSAHLVLTGLQRAGVLVALIIFTMGAIYSWQSVLTGIVVVITMAYLATSIHKLYLIVKGGQTTSTEELARDVAALDERALPIFTILVPLYREAVVLPQLTSAIQRLDWPKAKLDVRLLLEEDDVETIAAARGAELPPYFTFVIVPKSEPRGKPRACNYGLIHARGEYVVIYDAEDIPESDQLKKVYATFQTGGENLACVQCRLNFYNPEQNLLTRWFTSEYSMFFDLLLPGMQRAGVPVPLGGTSNHFRRDILERLGAWDPYNVTEDADLGVRLHKLGLRTVVIDSTTYEEANPRVGNWIRQRSRWIKGYVHTWLVHMRHPIALYRSLGWRGFWGFQFTIGGTGLTLLLNPIYWLLTLLWFGTHWGIIEQFFPGPIFYVGGLALYLGNFLFVYIMVAGTLARGYHPLVKYAFLSPLYWALMSVAAWKGVLQLIYAPSYWEKTEHGLATQVQHSGSALQGGEVA